MRISDFDFELPEELIAQQPRAARDAARMLVVDRARGAWRDGAFAELPVELAAGDALVVNNTRVFPARLLGVREATGGRVELLLVRQLTEANQQQRQNYGEYERDAGESNVWEALSRPAWRLNAGTRIVFGDGRLRAEIVSADTDTPSRIVRFEADGDFDALLEEFGRVPLPPYIKRKEEEDGDAGDAAPATTAAAAMRAADRERYQTIYAGQRGAIAAPTAGLHFTPRVFADLRARGVRVVELTLHVGYGTFAPVRADNLDEHRVAAEHYEITRAAADEINAARDAGRRVVAVGTTSVRALESCADEHGKIIEGRGATGLTITPGYNFRAVDALLTNFHLPRSSLLVLVSAFAGRELILDAYRHAVAARYRFYSYGDCMFIK